MSKLEFFCNRPTIVALIDFGLDLSSRNSAPTSTNATKASDDESTFKKDKTEENECVIVKGLLGYGKGRVIFYLNMNMDSLTVLLNKEDGSHLAMLVQESFLLDLKVMIIILLVILLAFFYLFSSFFAIISIKGC